MSQRKDTNVHVITQHRADGKSEYAPAADQTPAKYHAIEGCGLVQDLFATTGFPPSVSDTNDSKDMEATVKVREEGLLHTGRITVDNGLVAEMVLLEPGGSSSMHRTRTIDLIVLVEGEVELELDGGERRRFKQGDTMVIRGAGHKWTNVSGEGKWAKLFAATIDAKPVEVGGKVLEESWEL